MSSKVVIEVFGIRDQGAGGGGCGGGCSCGGGCGPAPTMGEMYQDLVKFMFKEDSEVKDDVTLRFIDVLEVDMDGHVAVKKALDSGIGLPLTAINGEPRFYGGLSTWQIFSEVKKILQK